jgi:hypothetical protein
MKKFCVIFFTFLLGWSGWSMSGSATGQSHGHAHGQHEAVASSDPSCHGSIEVMEAAESKLGGALYTGPEVEQHSGHSGHSHSMPEMEGAHMTHEPQHGGTFFMAPDKMHHLEGVYSDGCGFQLFMYNAFTEHIRVDRFQAFVHVFPSSEDEFDIIRFLSPSNGGTVLTTEFGDAVSQPFKIDLYVKFPESDEPQLFNIHVTAAETHGVKSSDIMLAHPWARPNLPNRPTAAYITIANDGENADRLLGARSPAFEAVELHLMLMDGDVMKMQPVEAIDLPANETVELAPGGFHMMLFGAQRLFKLGDDFPLVLTFEKAGKIEIKVEVAHGQSEHTGHGQHEHSGQGSN